MRSNETREVEGDRIIGEVGDIESRDENVISHFGGIKSIFHGD